MDTMPHPRHPRAASLHKLYAGVVAVFLGGAMVTLPPLAAPAMAQQGCRQQPAPAEVIPEVPWAQSWLAPERVWPMSRGRGVVVAVVDSGVDAGHPQLRQADVRAGTDLLEEPLGGRVDCDSHGTAVASIIAAAAVDGVGFAGLAPEVTILPVRVAERNQPPTDPEAEPPVTPGTFATGIRWATDQGADIINLSVAFYRDHRAIADAVQRAVRRGVLVVAAVGNVPSGEGVDLTPYPAAYPGVIGVGPIDPGGAVPDGAYAGPHLDLLAPGVQVTAAAARQGHFLWAGSSFAAPFVSATAALLLAADPDFTAAELTQRLLATADPGPGSREAAGYGVVNPYRAFTERLTGGEPGAAEPPAEVVVDPVAEARSQRWQRAGQLALLVTIGAAVLVALVVGGAAVWRRGSRYGWRPARRPDPPKPEPTEDPDDAPERRFFRVPTPRDQ